MKFSAVAAGCLSALILVCPAFAAKELGGGLYMLEPGDPVPKDAMLSGSSTWDGILLYGNAYTYTKPKGQAYDITKLQIGDKVPKGALVSGKVVEGVLVQGWAWTKTPRKDVPQEETPVEPSVATAASITGSTITGQCWTVSGNVASAMDMTNFVSTLTNTNDRAMDKISETLREAAKSREGSDAQILKARENLKAARDAVDFQTWQKTDSSNNLVYETSVDAGCGPQAAYYFNAASDAIGNAIALETAWERNAGMGVTEDMAARDRALAGLAGWYDRHGQFFADLTYTPEQMKAATAAVDLLMPEWKNPRPDDLKDNSHKDARYRVAEAQAAIFRVLISEPFYRLVHGRQAVVPMKEIYQYTGPNSTPYTTTDFPNVKNGQVGLQPVYKKIGEGDKGSMLTLQDAVYRHFTNEEWLATLDGKKSAAVLKEMLNLRAQSYGLLNDMRQSVQAHNALMSLQLMKRMKERTRNAD